MVLLNWFPLQVKVLAYMIFYVQMRPDGERKVNDEHCLVQYAVLVKLLSFISACVLVFQA